MTKPPVSKLPFIGSYIKDITLNFDLSGLKYFLEHNNKEVFKEFQKIEKRKEKGYYKTFEDYEPAFDMPLTRMEITIRAVFYELNAIVDHELQRVAHTPWVKSDRFKGPKTIPDITSGKIKDLKMISDRDITYGQIISLIEGYYHVRIEKLTCYKDIVKIRKKVNSFKHSKGLADFRNDKSEKLQYPHYYEIETKEAYDAIEHVRKFIKALREKTIQEHEY